MTARLLVPLALLAAATPAAQAQSASYEIDRAHTYVTWEVNHQNTSTLRGRFDKTSGRITLNLAARSGRAEITVDMGSISSGLAAFNEHLKQDGWLGAVKFPDATFVGDRFVFAGDKLAAVEGQLTFMGKSLPLTLKAQRFGCYSHPKHKKMFCGGDFEAVMQRSLWGSTAGLPGEPDTVKLVIQVEAAQL